LVTPPNGISTYLTEFKVRQERLEILDQPDLLVTLDQPEQLEILALLVLQEQTPYGILQVLG
jgi:hypothetical protein